MQDYTVLDVDLKLAMYFREMRETLRTIYCKTAKQSSLMLRIIEASGNGINNHVEFQKPKGFDLLFSPGVFFFTNIYGTSSSLI